MLSTRITVLVALTPLTVLASISAGKASAPLGDFNASQIGWLDLPNLDLAHLPPSCFKFEDICALEAAGKHELAFSMYESRYSSCGDAGWTLLGSGRGHNSLVAFKETPCGTRVAVKGSRDPSVNVDGECDVLRRLTAVHCPGCFPRFYYSSPALTGACYVELLPVVQQFSGHYHKEDADVSQLKRLKHLLVSGIAAAHGLWMAGLEHRNLPRNLLVVNGSASAPLRLVVIDMGHSVALTDISAGALEYFGGESNREFTDLHALACTFYCRLFNTLIDACRAPFVDWREGEEQATTLKSVLRLIMHEVGSDNKNMTMVWERRAQKPSFVRYAGLVEAVTAIA